MSEKEWLKKYQKGSLLGAVVFGAPLVLVLLYMFLYLPEPSVFQRQVARVIVAFAAGFLAYFFVGGIIVAGTARGFKISAGAGFALFILILFVYNPFPSSPPEQPIFQGQKLGTLVDMLETRYARGEISERIQFHPSDKDQLDNFKMQAREWTGETWIELVQRICDANSCLKCETSPDLKTLTLSVTGPVEKRCKGQECFEYHYKCK